MDLIVRHLEREEKVKLERHDHGYTVMVGESTYQIDLASAQGGALLSLRLDDGKQYEVAIRRTGSAAHGTYHVSSFRGVHAVEVMDPLTHLAEKSRSEAGGGKGEVRAYMPGRVVDILVAVGAVVVKGQGVLVLEAMKMKNEICADCDGEITAIKVQAGQAVENGEILFEIG
jgi:biotin carboxyl carrier protein